MLGLKLCIHQVTQPKTWNNHNLRESFPHDLRKLNNHPLRDLKCVERLFWHPQGAWSHSSSIQGAIFVNLFRCSPLVAVVNELA